MEKSGKGPRILLLYIAAATGHRQAAEVIRQTLRKLYPEAEVRRENLYQYGNSFLRYLLDSLYNAIIRLVPWFWDLIWDSKGVYWLTYGLRSFLYRLNYLRLYREVILPFNPQIVICTHNIPCALCSVIKKAKGANYLLAAVPTDFCLHSYWFYDNVDAYFVSHKGLKKKLVERGAEPGKIKITGIPISLNFSKSHNSKELREKWGLEEDLFTILLMGGGQGIGSPKEIILALDKSHLPVQLLVVTGTNRRLRKKIQKIQAKVNFPLKALGYTKQIDELMEVSHLLISKPGGLTTAEALAKEIPLGIFDSLAGQERRNKKFLLEKEIAFELKSKGDIVRLVRNLMEHSFDMENWRNRVKDLARPKAAEEITQTVMELIKNRRSSFVARISKR